MPCRECGGSAREDGSGGFVTDLRYDDDGTAHYNCLSCTVDILKEKTGCTGDIE